MNEKRGWLVVGAVALMLAYAVCEVQANNLQITNVTVIGRDDTTAYVQFDISWENSWRYENAGDPLYFHDAVWVFFKVLPHGQTEWEHVTLEGTGTNPTDYVTGAGTPIEMVVPSERVGMFVRRSSDGAETTSVQNVKAVWNFATNGLVKTEKVKLQGFGLEMVYVAEGSFKVGSGGTGVGELFEGGGGTAPFAITNAGPIECGDETGKLWGASQLGNSSMGGAGMISSNFSNGYLAFYCMKYEITQGQYVDFLNTLMRDQQEARCRTTTLNDYMPGIATIGWRNTVQLTADPGISAPRTYTTVTPDRVCNYLSWADMTAFADWAGLRPMTELEFEKACRGPLEPMANEFAWGDAAVPIYIGSESSDGSGTSTANPLGANCCWGRGLPGPCRAGIFAKPGSTRVQAGASYWGIMELSGNAYERAVSIGNTAGRAFTGQHGNGVLTSIGAADVSNWPVAGGTGAGMRGGCYYSMGNDGYVSDRNISTSISSAGLEYRHGGRVVRSACLP